MCAHTNTVWAWVGGFAKRGYVRSLTHTGAAAAHAKGGALLQRWNVCGRVCMYLSRVSTLWVHLSVSRSVSLQHCSAPHAALTIHIKILAYLPNKVTAGTTPFVARSLNSAAIDPGGSVGVWGHLRPLGAGCSQLRRFELWLFTTSSSRCCHNFELAPTVRIDPAWSS